jgi:hypothetical protein
MFSRISRYRKLPDVTTLDARGRTLAARTLRLLPDVTGVFRHTVEAGDRLDQLAYKYYAEPLHWWNICDANPAFLSPLSLIGKDTVVTVRFPVTVSEPPPWAALFRSLAAMPGVEHVEVVEDVDLVPRSVTVSGQTIGAMVEHFSRSVLVTYNEQNLTAATVAAAIATARFVVAPFIRLDQLGQQIVIPPKPVG